MTKEKRTLDAEIHKYIAASWAWEGRAKRGNNPADKARYATINRRLAKPKPNKMR